MKKGIDISYYQKKVDWSIVSGIDFVIIRAGYGRYVHQKDSMFESHYAGAKKAGIPVGAYWYSYAMNAEEAKKEAETCIAVLSGKQFEYPIYFDIEEQKQLSLGKKEVSAIIRAFLETVEKAGYFVGLYMSASPLSNLVEQDILKRYAVWVAHVGVTKPSYTGSYGMWQFTWKEKINGISGDVDGDYAYIDYPAKIKEKGLNGFEEPDEETPETQYPITIYLNGHKYAGTVHLAD